MGTARPNGLEAVKSSLEAWLKPATRRVLEEELTNGDTIRTGLAIEAGNIACALAREEKSPVDPQLLESIIVQLGDAKGGLRIFEAYNNLGALAYNAVGRTLDNSVSMGLHTYFVNRSKGVRRGLFVCDRGPIDIPNSRRIHGHDRRGFLSEYAEFLARRLPPTSLEDVLSEEYLEAIEALGSFAQKIGQDLLGIMDPVPTEPHRLPAPIAAFFDELRTTTSLVPKSLSS